MKINNNMRKQSESQEIAAHIAETAREIFGGVLKNVILYGSYARGDYDDDSDVDIMVIVDISAADISKYRDDFAVISSRLSLRTTDCVTVSVVLQDKETFDKYKNVLPFYRNVLNEGVVLYAA